MAASSSKSSPYYYSDLVRKAAAAAAGGASGLSSSIGAAPSPGSLGTTTNPGVSSGGASITKGPTANETSTSPSNDLKSQSVLIGKTPNSTEDQVNGVITNGASNHIHLHMDTNSNSNANSNVTGNHTGNDNQPSPSSSNSVNNSSTPSSSASLGGQVNNTVSPSSSSSSCHIYGYANREPIPASFANPLLSIEPDTRGSLPRNFHHYKKGANAPLSSNVHKSPASGGSGVKQGIYAKSLSLIANGVSPLLRKKPSSHGQPSAHSSPSASATSSPLALSSQANPATSAALAKAIENQHQSLNNSASNSVNHYQNSPSPSDPNSFGQQQQPKTAGGVPLSGSTSSLARRRRKSEPIMFSLDSITNEISRLQQRQEQILENLNVDFDTMLITDQQQNNSNPSAMMNSGVASGQSNNASSVPSGNNNALMMENSQMNPNMGHITQPVNSNYDLALSTASHTGPFTKGEYGRAMQAAQAKRYQAINHQQQQQQLHHQPAYQFQGSKEPLYMYDDAVHHGRSSSRNDDNIYEEIDIMTLASLRAQYADTLSLQSWKKKGGSKRSLATSSFTRWFSTRKKSSPSSTMTSEIDLENPYVDVKFSKKQRPPICLPDIPAQGLTAEQLKRRYIVGSIVDSENSYINALHRLINDYKKPLEEASPAILSQNKINIIFHRVEQLHQCHTIFGIALSQCVREWDEKERIGDVFVASFSKPMVLDIYSDFINNFTHAMETARKATKSKTAFAQFLHDKSLSSPDRLSFFGLMVKPVQRFPQFILLLTDLLKHTPNDHPDRMSLQLALTQLESLADRLNERKRDAERHFAVKQLLKDYLSSSAANNSQRYLIRQDDIYVLDLDASTGLVLKTKCRKLYLLNDMLICVSVPSNRLKFAVQLQEVDVIDDVTPATNNLLANSMLRSKDAGSPTSAPTPQHCSVERMYCDLSNLMHDLEMISRIANLIGSLRYQYNGLSVDAAEHISSQIREEIRRKDAQITLIDRSCFQLRIRSKNIKDTICVQMSDPEMKRDFLTDVRLAKLALDRSNNPAWDIVDGSLSASSTNLHAHVQPRAPLFVKSLPIFATTETSQLTCALHYRLYRGPLSDHDMGVLWICNVNENGSQLGALATNGSDLSLIHSYELCDSHVTCLESVGSLTVWIGLRQGRIIVINANSPGEWQQFAALDVGSEVTCMRHFGSNVYIGLVTGMVAIFDAIHYQEPIIVNLSQSPVTCMLPVNDEMYCCSHNKIWVINGHQLERSYSLSSGSPTHEPSAQNNVDEHDIISAASPSTSPLHHAGELRPNLMAHCGIGLWVSCIKSPVIKLFHTETFKHLQDINVASNVKRVIQEPNVEIFVTSMLATRGLLWVGTNVGVTVTLTLPRLQGVPLISGCLNVALHRHLGPVNILLSLTPGADCIPHIPTAMQQKASSLHSGSQQQLTNEQKSQIEDMESIYGLYSDLMNVGDYVGVRRASQNVAIQRMAWDLSNMNISDDSTSESASSAIYGSQSGNAQGVPAANPFLQRQLHSSQPPPGSAAAVAQAAAMKAMKSLAANSQTSPKDEIPPGQMGPMERRPHSSNHIYESKASKGMEAGAEGKEEAPPGRPLPGPLGNLGLNAEPGRPKSVHSNQRPQSAAAMRRNPTPHSNEVIYDAAPAPSMMTSINNGKTALLLTGGNGYKRISQVDNPYQSQHAHCIIWEYKI